VIGYQADARWKYAKSGMPKTYVVVARRPDPDSSAG
jgi:hypothetical protein